MKKAGRRDSEVQLEALQAYPEIEVETFYECEDGLPTETMEHQTVPTPIVV